MDAHHANPHYLIYPNTNGTEFFAGLGFMYKDISYKNAAGKLVEANRSPMFDEAKSGMEFFPAIGGRIIIRLK